jgi:hypothetical protein
VLVDGEGYEGPFYVKNPFTHEPDWAVTSENLDLHALLSRAEQAHGWCIRKVQGMEDNHEKMQCPSQLRA